MSKSAGCSGCPMENKLSDRADFKSYFSEGDSPEGFMSEVLFVAMAPSWEDENAGGLFNGDNGKVIKAFADKCFFTYAISCVVRCRPIDTDGKSRVPAVKEIMHCESYLKNLVSMLTPKVIVLVGEPASKYYLEGMVGSHITKGKVNVGKLRGKVFGEGNVKIMCMYHPGYYLRKEGPGVNVLKEHYFSDFNLIESLANGTYVKQNAVTEYITDHKDALDLVKMVRLHNGLVSVDFEVDTNEDNPETSSLYKFKTQPLSVGISIDGKTGYCLPLNHKESPFNGKHMPIAEMLEGKTLLSHNVMYELQCLDRFYDVDPGTVKFEDSLLLSYILNPDDKAGRDLKTLTSKYTPYGGYETDLQLYFDKLPVKDKDFGHIPMTLLSPYNAYDAVCAYLVYERLLEQVEGAGRADLYEWLKDKVAMLATMTHNGILFNYPAHKQIKKNLDRNIWRVHSLLMQHDDIQSTLLLTGAKDFNVKSSQQKQKLLFDVLKLVPIKKTPSDGKSADGDTLKHYKSIPLVDAVLAEIKCRDALSKYIGPLDVYICEDGAGHPLFNIAKTVTGRLSSSAFSIQIIPRSPDMRDMFRSKEKFKLVSVDLSQAELWVMAVISNDQEMINAFKTGKDIHQQTGDMVGVSRQDAKIVNFGIIYGMSARGLSAELNIGVDDAEGIINKYMEMFSGVRRYTQIIRDMVLKGQPIYTPFGRVRVFKYDKKDKRAYEESCRQAVNYPIQSIASDIMLLIGNKICKLYGHRLDKTLGYSNPVLHGDKMYVVPHALIHDEILVSVADRWVETYKIAGVNIAQTIELPFKFDIPLIADASSGMTWGEIARAHK